MKIIVLRILQCFCLVVALFSFIVALYLAGQGLTFPGIMSLINTATFAFLYLTFKTEIETAKIGRD